MTQMDDVAAALAKEFPRCRINFRLDEKTETMRAEVHDDEARRWGSATWKDEGLEVEDMIPALVEQIQNSWEAA